MNAFKIAFVCTANRIRSPLAEAITRRASTGLPVEVFSAGILEPFGAGAISEAVAAASEIGLDLSQHSSRGLQDVAIADLDLVLGFEMIHAATAVVEHGAPSERAFTLPEIVTLLEEVPLSSGSEPTTRARAAIADAAQLRREAPGSARAEEIHDPLGGPPAAYAAARDRIAMLCSRLVALLFDKSEIEGGLALERDTLL